jgi:hypothetical protein|tara:strand:- start:40 stop:303 length:264 start_codon:yes stop_codon:yes gene_type:complete
MATGRYTFGICDVCGFRYRLKDLKKNSYGMMVCSMDYDGSYDRKNHPQNKNANVTDDITVKDPRPRSPMPATNVTVTDWLPPYPPGV